MPGPEVTKKPKTGRQGLFESGKTASMKRPSIAVRIVDTVLGALFKGEAKAGDFLGTESSICETFEASRFPVREALSRLEALGIVEIRRGVGGGIWIAQGNPDHFAEFLAMHFLLADLTPLELFEARLAIVPKAAEHAAIHATAKDIVRLRGFLDTVEDQSLDFETRLQALLDFHLQLVELSKLRSLTALNRSLVHLMNNLYQTYVPPVFEPHSKDQQFIGVTNLRSLLEKIEAGDGQGASDLARNAITGHRDAVLEVGKIRGRS